MDGLPNINRFSVTQVKPSDGAGTAQGAQARAFSQVAQAASQIGSVMRANAEGQAKRDAIRDFADQSKRLAKGGTLEFERRSGPLGVMMPGDAAYNNMMETLYLQRAQGEAESMAAQLRTEKFGDVDGFDKAYGAYMDGVIGSTDIAFTPETQLMLERIRVNGRTGVAQDRAQSDRKEAIQGMDARIETIAQRIESVLRDQGVDALQDPEVLESIADLNDQMDIKAANPLYGYSEEQRALDGDKLAAQLEAAALLPEISKVYADEGYAAALEAADGMADTLNRDTAQQARIRSLLRNEVSLLQQNHNARMSELEAQRKADAERLKTIGEEYDKRATDVINAPGATIQQRVEAVRRARPYVSPERYGTLLGRATDETVGNGVGDSTFTEYRIMAMRNELSIDQVAELSELSNTQRDKLIDEIERTQNETLKVGNDMFAAAFKVGAFEGVGLGDAQRLGIRENEARQQLAAWASGLEYEPTPADVRHQAREILKNYNRTTALAEGSPYISTNITGIVSPEDLENARSALRRDLDAGRIDPKEAADQAILLEQIEDSLNDGTR